MSKPNYHQHLLQSTPAMPWLSNTAPRQPPPQSVMNLPQKRKEGGVYPWKRPTQNQNPTSMAPLEMDSLRLAHTFPSSLLFDSKDLSLACFQPCVVRHML